MWEVDETIVAIASPTSPAARGIVRLSGPDVIEVLVRLGLPAGTTSRPSRAACHLDLGEPIGEVPIDVLVWPTRRSYTGQPSAELHTFGSLPLLSRVTEMVVAAGGRAARPGEFTMRAFLAGRLDLTQAEAVLGVIDAEGRGSLDHALRQLSGNLSRPLETMRSTLLDLLADVEASLDFVDEDIEFISDENLIERLSKIAGSLHETIQTMQSRGGGSARATVALRGEPNAGKSQLLNRLSGANSAIVTDVAGTTRDTVTVEATIDGVTVRLIDTAGIELVVDDITRQAQDQAIRAADAADVRLWCVDSSRDDFADALDRLRAGAATSGRPGVIDWFIATKSDLKTHSSLLESDTISCSTITDEGIDGLQSAIRQSVLKRDAEETGSVVGTAARCSQSLTSALEAIDAAIELTRHRRGHEFVSAEMRSAAQNLGEVTGAVYTDDILDRVFGRFCIGK